MNKNLIAIAMLTMVANNVFGAIAGRVTVINDKNNPGDIWVTFNSRVASCLGGCDYKRVQPGKDVSPWNSIIPGNTLVNIYGYSAQGGQVRVDKKEGYRAKTDKLRVMVKNGKVMVKEEGTAYDINITVEKQGAD